MADATGEGKESRSGSPSTAGSSWNSMALELLRRLLAYRELDDTVGLTATAASTLAEGRRGKNIRHRLLGLLRQAVYGSARRLRDAVL